MDEKAVLEVSQPPRQRSEAQVSTDFAVDVYMIRTPRHRPTLFLPRPSLDLCAQTELDWFRRFIRKMTRNRNAVIRWVGRVTRGAHRYYERLEDRIDPLERMIKALNSPNSFRVLHAPGAEAPSRFRDLLRAQIAKHTAWMAVDGVLTAIAVMFFWVLVPIPGPNIFFYYPALRLLSHYRAMTGARRALNSGAVTFATWPQLAGVEEDLRNPSVRGRAGARVGIKGLDRFLKRMI